MAYQVRDPIAISAIDGAKFLKALGLKPDEVPYIESARLVIDAGGPIKLEVTYLVTSEEMGLFGQAVAEYELRRTS